MMTDEASSTLEGPEVEQVRTTERERLRALVAGNMDVARDLHADDFQLINPHGGTLSKEQYLGGIARGEIKYLMWEPAPTIDVRLYGPVAIIRYQAHLEVVGPWQKEALHCWHTDYYEKRNGRWQVVWSQATAIG